MLLFYTTLPGYMLFTYGTKHFIVKNNFYVHNYLVKFTKTHTPLPINAESK